MLPSYKATLWPEPLGGCLGIEFVYMTHVNDTCRSHNMSWQTLQVFTSSHGTHPNQSALGQEEYTRETQTFSVDYRHGQLGFYNQANLLSSYTFVSSIAEANSAQP